jgi:hypothetical protein
LPVEQVDDIPAEVLQRCRHYQYPSLGMQPRSQRSS